MMTNTVDAARLVTIVRFWGHARIVSHAPAARLLTVAGTA